MTQRMSAAETGKASTVGYAKKSRFISRPAAEKNIHTHTSRNEATEKMNRKKKQHRIK